MLWEVQTNVFGDLFSGDSVNYTAQTWFTANWNKTLFNFVCTTNILYDYDALNATATTNYNIFSSQQDLSAVNTTDNNATIFDNSTELYSDTNTSTNTSYMFGDAAGANLYYISSIRCSGIRLLNSFDPALPPVNMNDTFTFSTGAILYENDYDNSDQEAPLVVYQSDPRSKPVSYKVGDPTPIQPNAPNAFAAW